MEIEGAPPYPPRTAGRVEDRDNKMLEIQFVNLVSALAASAMQQLGKLVNPLTGKTEINLQGAKATIDLLEMLQAKTAGNLNQDEANLLRSTLSNLQLNYVDEATGKGAQPYPPRTAGRVEDETPS